MGGVVFLCRIQNVQQQKLFTVCREHIHPVLHQQLRRTENRRRVLDTARNPDVELLIPRIDRFHQPRIQLIAPVLSDLPQRKNHLNQIHPGALVLNCQGMKHIPQEQKHVPGPDRIPDTVHPIGSRAAEKYIDFKLRMGMVQA